ncbi:YveK family protein [Bacillus sp. mrc49]|uniref:YveK family protein n=1 Tax=Bacillus sp. mrc49 TaxID=2054913 RepID=UPI000C27016F|nr:Wzz/FepE/Etk N-terminal domain-containing protein [Bacillus sp. mrc49]PJN90311.1 capsular biosynthesis protein [Bacillus sp. mrc49]
MVENNEISLRDIVQIWRKHKLFLIIFCIAGISIASFWVYVVVTPKYEMSNQILVTQSESVKEGLQNPEIEAAIRLVNTYSLLIKSQRVLNDVNEALDYEYSYNELANKISVDNVENSQIINIRVLDENPQKAALIVNEVAKSFKEITSKVMKVDNINILSEAEVPQNRIPVTPNKSLAIFIGGITALVVGLISTCAYELLNNKIKDEEDILNLLDIPVFGVVGNIDEPN